MATGRSNMLIKQIGEYLVACELARRGLVVATFSGNVPDFDQLIEQFGIVKPHINTRRPRHYNRTNAAPVLA